MTWAIKQNDQSGIIQVTFTGPTTGQDLRDATSKAIELSKELSITKVLVDVSQMEVLASTIDIYNLPNIQYVEEGLDRRVRVALIQPDTLKERNDVHFYETACVNRGWQVQTFPGRDAAIAWLNGNSPNKLNAGDV